MKSLTNDDLWFNIHIFHYLCLYFASKFQSIPTDFTVDRKP